MGALMRAHDWSLTPLGDPARWPQALRTTVRLMLTTGHAMFIFWGAEGTCFYNDAYRRSLGPERHPGALGKPARAVWDEIWDIIGHQITQVMDQIKHNPDSRRMIVSAWNVADIPKMKLPPCHALFQFYVADGKLSCQLYQRSADIFLGVPFNIASYALLTHMMAQQAGLDVGDFVWTGGDCHLYSNHMEQVELQLARAERPLPKLVIKRKPDSLFDYKFEDFEITGYDPHPAIKAPVAV